MNAPAWLREFYRQWAANRGRNLAPNRRPFSRNWEDLLDAACLKSAADRNFAAREAEAIGTEGHLSLRRHKYRPHIIESVNLPVSEESWLVNIFGEEPASSLLERSLAIVRHAGEHVHPLLPKSWASLRERLLSAFGAGKNLAPFFWESPGKIFELLELIRALTSREWRPGTLVGQASTDLGLGSKYLEENSTRIEAALALLFGEDAPLESLGIIRGQSRAFLHGPLALHFSDGTTQRFEGLRGEISVSLADLLRAVRAETSASRILSIENARTTFAQAVSRNRDGGTLLISTSYPSQATRRLLELLPPSLPHYHYGDTDPSGYAILRSLRGATARPVYPFRMAWRDSPDSPKLGERDLQILPALIADPTMADLAADLIAMRNAGRKGKFEQELAGHPTADGWPFWGDRAEHPPSEARG